MATLRDRLIAALEAQGYRRAARQPSTKYVVLTHAYPTETAADVHMRPPGDAPLVSGEHRVLVGRHGALRWTATTIAESRAFSERMVQRLIANHGAT